MNFQFAGLKFAFAYNNQIMGVQPKHSNAQNSRSLTSFRLKSSLWLRQRVKLLRPIDLRQLYGFVSTR